MNELDEPNANPPESSITASSEACENKNDEEVPSSLNSGLSPMYRGAVIVLGVAIFQEIDWLPLRFAVVAAGITAIAMEQRFKFTENS